MEYINITQDNLNNFKIFNKGGFEGKIYLYDKDILMKIFEPYLKDIIDIESKQYKLEKIYSKNINEKILLKPIKLVKINDSFSGYLIKKINKKKQIDEIQEIDLLLELYIKLFNNIEILHQNNIVVGFKTR
jgi:hypothetical protein